MFNTCKCGCGTPVGKVGTYLNSAHKQRAYRQRKRNQYRALSRAVSAKLYEVLGSKKADEVCSYLNRIPTDKYNRELDKALLLLMTWFEAETNKSGVNNA